MAWTKTKMAVVVGMGVLLAGGTATVTVNMIRNQNDPVQKVVRDIVRTNNWNYLSDNAELQELVDIGPRALPALRKMVEWHESYLDREYGKLWPSLPASVRQRLQDPSEQQQIHQKAVQIVYELGPAAIRPLTTALCSVLRDSDVPIAASTPKSAVSSRPARGGRGPGAQTTRYALQALYWSIPESATAVAETTNWLSDPTRAHLFGTTESDEIWPSLPKTAPLFAQFLRNPRLASGAAEALGFIGTNALEAVPALIEVCDRGVAEPPLNPIIRAGSRSPNQPALMNRAAAFGALGKIGQASKEVLAALGRGLADENEPIRFAALKALVELHQPLDGRLAGALKNFDARRSIEFQQIIEWTGTLGSDGREALPWLRRFVRLDEIQKLPEGVQANTGDFTIEPDYFRLTALVAVCRIDPGAAHQYLPDLVAQIGARWEPVELLTNSNEMSPEIVASLEPLLGETNLLRPAIAAYIILAHEPKHPQAQATLRNLVARGALNERISASRWLWERTGETNEVVPLCIEGLSATESNIGQTAAYTLEKMGQAARPAVPALQAALWHPDRYLRERAGKALRKIAPAEMPPIH